MYVSINGLTTLSTSLPISFHPRHHNANHTDAKATPYDAPAKTCRQVWCPSQTLDMTIVTAQGSVMSGGRKRDGRTGSNDGCIGR